MGLLRIMLLDIRIIPFTKRSSLDVELHKYFEYVSQEYKHGYI